MVEPVVKARCLIRGARGWLDGMDGERYEWTQSRATAWRMTPKEAEVRLRLVLKEDPTAWIVPPEGK